MTNSHTLSAVLYAMSNSFERASYYGVRAILILYMIGETLQMPQAEALEFYGWLTMSFYFSKVFGALIGDLVLGSHKTILIGGFIQAIGCFLLCVESQPALYLSVGLIVLGNGLYSPNVIGQFGRQYSHKPRYIDAGFSGLFFFINLGAFLGVLGIGTLGNVSFKYGFIIGGILMLIATALAFLSKNTETRVTKAINSYDNNILKAIVYCTIAIVFSGVFWACYEVYYGTSLSLTLPSNFDTSKIFEWSSIVAGVFTLVLAFIWTFIYTNQFAKFGIGLILSAFAVSLLISYPDEGNSTTIIMSSLCLAIGEALLSPMLFSITTRYTNPKYLAILLSLVSLPVLMFNKLATRINEWINSFDASGIFIAISTVLFILGIIAFIMWYVQKRDDHEDLVKNEIMT